MIYVLEDVVMPTSDVTTHHEDKDTSWVITADHLYFHKTFQTYFAVWITTSGVAANGLATSSDNPLRFKYNIYCTQTNTHTRARIRTYIPHAPPLTRIYLFKDLKMAVSNYNRATWHRHKIRY